MNTFDNREKGFENKYAHDQEMLFKVNSRRNKLVGLWAAEKLGRAGEAAEAYAKEVVLSDFEKAGDDDVVEKLLKDFAAATIAMTEKDIRMEMQRCLEIAREQLGGNP